MMRARSALLICTMFASAAIGQVKDEKVVSLTAVIEPAAAEPGEIVELKITAKMAPTWHIYAVDAEGEDVVPTAFTARAPFEAFGDLSADREPLLHELEGVGEIAYHEEEVVLSVSLFIDVDAAPGKIEVAGTLAYMACTMKGCKPPAEDPVKIAFEILPAAAKAADPEPTKEDGEPATPGAWSDGEVRVKARLEPARAAPGDKVKMIAELTIAPTWHIYDPAETNEAAFPTAFVPASGWKKVGLLEPDHAPHVWELEGVGELSIFENKVVFTQELIVPAGVVTSSALLLGYFDYIPCTMEYCLDRMSADATVAFEATLVGAGGAAVAPTATGAISPEGKKLKESLDRGLLSFMAWCGFFALLALLTPCVYPMIPITVSYFTKAGHQTRREAASHAGAYALGIIVTYVAFGIIVRAVLGDQGPTWIATYGPVNLIVAGVFIVFGLSLLGMFEIRLPDRWVSGMNAVAGRTSGYLGDLLMGFTFTLAAFTCTVPVVAIILTLGVTASTFHMFLGMLTYATVFAAPFFLLALMPSMVKSMPRSGGWLESVKIVLAFIELAAAFKFLNAADAYFFPPTAKIFTYTVVVLTWGVLMLLTGIYLLRIFRFAHEEPVEGISAMRMLAAASFLVLGVYLTAGAFGRPLAPWIASIAPAEDAMLQPRAGDGAGDGADDEALAKLPSWERAPKFNGPKDWAAARAHAAATGTPIFLEYSGFQ